MDKVIVITGPTAVGKTKMSTQLAKLLNGEIINADSTQVFRELDIATAKITEQEKEGIIHHLFDIKNIDEDYTVYDYQNDCRNKIEEIRSKGKTPILVGGTGLYIKAALYDYRFNEYLENPNYDELTNEEIKSKIMEFDPNSDIHINNRKRLVSNLKSYELDQPKNNLGKNTLMYDAIFIGLTTSRDILYDRINKRVNVMLESGLLEEAKKIYDTNIRSKAVMTPIGYKELFDYFEGTKDIETCIDLIKQRSRRYAKRQYTWFNNQMNIHWIQVNFNNFDETVTEALNYIKIN